MVSHDVFNDGRLVVIFLVRDGDLMNYERRALSILFKVFTVPRVARNDYRPPIVIDAVAVRRLYEIAVVDFKSSHFHAIGLIDDAVLGVLRRRYFYPFYRVFSSAKRIRISSPYARSRFCMNDMVPVGPMMRNGFCLLR